VGVTDVERLSQKINTICYVIICVSGYLAAPILS
jgi:hypothetical protein